MDPKRMRLAWVGEMVVATISEPSWNSSARASQLPNCSFILLCIGEALKYFDRTKRYNAAIKPMAMQRIDVNSRIRAMTLPVSFMIVSSLSITSNYLEDVWYL